MELVNQKTKQIMEGCKERARKAGLSFEEETLEYIVTNRDLIELTPKLMIPTLYDYWVHDVEVMQEKSYKGITIDGCIEIFENWMPEKRAFVYGIPVADILDIRKYKEQLGRDKDLRDIELIDRFLEKENKF
jgi:hypothetical protein